MAIILFLVFSLLLQGTLGELICDELPAGMCAFSIASSGKRCSLETGDQPGLFQCKTSEVFVHRIHEHIESDECITACGADRNAVGISSDSLLDPIFTAKLCSKQCLHNCPNIVDLYTNLALAEGALLSKLCKALERGRPRRATSQLQSSGIAASSPVSAVAAGGPMYAAAAGPISDSADTVAPALSPLGSPAVAAAASAPAPL